MDKIIDEKKGMLGKHSSDYAIMVDKGFIFSTLPPAVKIYRPPFRQRHEQQITAEVVANTRQIASTKVHIEIVIG